MNHSVIVRLATPKDAEEIALESMAEIEHNMNWNWTPQKVCRAIDDPNTNVAVVIEEGQMIAFGVMEYQDDAAHLLLFGVSASARRCGVGSSLLKWLERVAHVAGVQRFKVEARSKNTTARAFYRKHGYSELETVPKMYQGSVDGVRMEKLAGSLPEVA